MPGSLRGPHSSHHAGSSVVHGDPVADAVAVFSHRIAEKLGRGGENEEQLRAPTEELFRNLGLGLGLDVIPYGEVRLPEFGVRPDFAVDLGRDRIGFIELKAPGTGVPPDWRRNPERNGRQYERMRDLPNLLYSDGTCWRLIRTGDSSESVITLEGDIEEGTLRPPSDGSFHDLINKFIGWQPERPRSLSRLIKIIAGPCRVLRFAVSELIEQEAETSGVRTFTRLAEDWRELLFPKLEIKDFPDAYAQTITFALLLAREGGISFQQKDLHEIAEQLGKQHPLMGRALHVLTHTRAVQKLKILDTLRVVIGALDWQKLRRKDRDKYWDLYEPFLTEYDKELRRRSGSYYTPEPIARFMVEFTDDILRNRLQRRGSFADESVFTMDPAMGTGTFLVEVLRSVARTSIQAHNIEYARGVLRELCRHRLIGFERSAAPYVVAELRLHQTLREVYGAEPPERSMRFLTNTLDDPGEPHEEGLEYAEIIESRKRADEVKRKTPIVAIIGNPPYVTRARQRDPAPWIEAPRTPERRDNFSDRPSLDDFREVGNGQLEYSLSNTGTYFWRWSTWKVFDSHPFRAGIVALITTSAYLTGPAFEGMRRYLRETCDEGWIIDLSPEGHRPRVSTRVFRGVKEPICIGVFIRTRESSARTTPAIVRYRALLGSRDEKFAALEHGFVLTDDGWSECPRGWTDDFLPEDSAWVAHPKIDEIAQWGESGIKPGLTWVYAPRPEVLEERWASFTAARDRELLFKDPELPGRRMPQSLAAVQEMPRIEECAFRAFDREYILADPRLADRLRMSLWNIRGRHQVYASIQHDKALKAGPGVIFTHLIPDQHHFAARGGKVIPLYKHSQTQDWSSNIPLDFRQYLAARLGGDSAIIPEDVFAYIAAIAAHPGYTQIFWESLRRPGIRVPFTADKDLWATACELGEEVIWLHTFGMRYHDVARGRPEGAPRLPRGRRPEIIKEISDGPDATPDMMQYDSRTGYLQLADGIIGPVEEGAFEYRVGDKRIIDQWFSFRQRTRQHQRRMSPLDDIRVKRWTYHLSRDLLDLINVLTMLVVLEARQERLLQEVCHGSLIRVDELRTSGILPPSRAGKRAPRPPNQDELRYDAEFF
jgi:Type ISP C-terminal specificity domain/N-6 DNA Methylase